jgi:hypothetical protein
VSASNWSRQFGEEHGNRDRAAAHEAQARTAVEQQAHAQCIERWPSIVAAMKALVLDYNEGAGSEAITLVEDAEDRCVTLESTVNGHGSLVIALDGSDVAVRTRNGPDRKLSGPTWVPLNRTDDNAAEYLLRDWMERL